MSGRRVRVVDEPISGAYLVEVINSGQRGVLISDN
jgi:hypothetical protein